MPSAVAFLAARVVGAVLLVAGVRKLGDRAFVPAAARLGVPRPLAVAVPPAELVLGVALVAGVATRWASLCACVLLGAFTGVILRALGRPDRPPCACFGATASRPMSGRDVARNVALLACALAAVSAR